MRFIGLGHRKGTGKDTLANMLVEEIRVKHRTAAVKLSFADGIKDLSYSMFERYGLKEGQYYEQNEDTREEKEQPIGGVLGDLTPRDIYIKVGQFMRSIDEDYWVTDLFHRADAFNAGKACPAVVVVPDVRFPNEIKKFKREGYPLIKVTNPRIADTNDVCDDALDGFDDWDHLVVNSGSLHALREMGNALCKAWFTEGGCQ